MGVSAEGDRVAGFGRLEDGLGASHQTGWSGLIADVIRRRHGAVCEIVDLVGDLIDPLE